MASFFHLPTNPKTRQILFVSMHILFWACYIFLPLFLIYNPQSNLPAQTPAQTAQNDKYFYPIFFFINFLSVLIFYTNAEWLIPKFFQKKKYQLYTLFVIITLGIAIVCNYGFRYWLMDTPPRTFFTFTPFYLFMSVIGISACYRLLNDYQSTQRLQNEREKVRLQSELSFLRSQISPHFMFNLMNSLASLARKKSDLLEPVIIKMSDLLRYMLYDSDEKKVPISKEANYLRSYVELQQLRFGQNVRIDLNIDIQNENIALEPMLLIPFVENAFKHGTGLIKAPFITILLQSSENKLKFVVTNRYTNAANDTKDGNSGIGLANVNRRLELLYPDLHQLEIHTENHLFVADLTLIFEKYEFTKTEMSNNRRRAISA